MNIPHCSTKTPCSLTVTCAPADDEILRIKAQILRKTLQLKQDVEPENSHLLQLVYTAKGLELQTLNSDTGHYNTTLTTDFIRGNTGYRRFHGGGIRQSLARAMGLKPGKRPTIVDATAGLGVDSFILASLGCKVTMIERSPIMWALLTDGLDRAASDPTTREVEERIQLLYGNAQEIITNLHETPSTIYLDPMYPHRHTSALNKQEMRVIRALVGEDQDAADLLETALAIAANRVIVKRPKSAPELNTRKPSHVIKMKNSRFDVYMTYRQNTEGN